jgi:hypothetical protein
MSTALSPLVSEFETAEQQASYTAWLQTKVAASLAAPRRAIPPRLKRRGFPLMLIINVVHARREFPGSS